MIVSLPWKLFTFSNASVLDSGDRLMCNRNPVLKRLKMWNASTEEKQSQYLLQDNISDYEESLPFLVP